MKKRYVAPDTAPLLERAAAEASSSTPEHRNGYLFLKCPACGSIMVGNFYPISPVPKNPATLVKEIVDNPNFVGDCSTLNIDCACGVHFHGFTRIGPAK